MSNSFIRFLVIFLIVTITSLVVNYIRNKIYKPKYENKVQKPGKLEVFIVKFLLFLDVFLFLFAILGIVMKEAEMAVVFGCLALFILVVTLFLKSALNTSYQENNEYFILKIRNKKYQVFYENIVDWKPSYNEIAILDQTNTVEEYIRVNIKIFKPEILLRKIADMAFEGKFNNLENQHREVETVNYLIKYNYSYLVEDYIEKLANKQT